MIDFISGKIVGKNPTFSVVDVNGIGYSINTSLYTYEKLPEVGENVTIKTYLHVREDILQLYGFSEEKERNIFLGLISVSGIGPKQAQTILSGIPINDLALAISEGNIDRLTSISGVGKKTAQRLVVELKEKFKTLGLIKDTDEAEDKIYQMTSLEQEALMALVSLGYRRQTAEIAIAKIRKTEKLLSVEELIKKVLQVF